MPNHSFPILTVDIVLLTMIDGRLKVALMERDKEPERGCWGLVGGFVHVDEDEDSSAAAMRILREKLRFSPGHLEQVVTEANAHRDPRGWSASIVHLALNEPSVLEVLGQREGLKLFDVHDDGARLPGNLAFDHSILILKAVDRLRAKAAYSTICCHLLPETFLLAEMQEIYEGVLGKKINPANFRRKVLDAHVLDPVGLRSSSGRPAQAYRLARPLDYFERQIA